MRAGDSNGAAHGEWRARIRPILAGTTLLATRIRATTIRAMWDSMAATIGGRRLLLAGNNSSGLGVLLISRVIWGEPKRSGGVQQEVLKRLYIVCDRLGAIQGEPFPVQAPAPKKPLAEVVPHRKWRAPSDRRRFTGVKSIQWRGRAMKFQPSVVRNSLFIFVAIVVLGVLVDAVGAQEKPTANDKAASAAKFRAAKKQVSGAAAVDADESSDKGRKGQVDQDGPDAIRKREEWFYKQRAFPNSTLPPGARLKAYQHRQRMLEAEGKLVRRSDGTLSAVNASINLSLSNWAPLGPTPTTGGFFSPVSGRITAIAVDPSDASGNTVLIGGAQGGIWRSIDA